jgi:alpha-glucosidase
MRPGVVTLAITVGLAGLGRAEPLSVSSPSGTLTASVDVVEGRTVYAVTSQGVEVIRPSGLGLVFEGAARLESNLEIVSHSRAGTRSSWKPVYGERSEFPDRFNALTVEARERIPPGRTLVVEFRAYDEAVTFRYQVPAQPQRTTAANRHTRRRAAPVLAGARRCRTGADAPVSGATRPWCLVGR